jgi:hypothetical protein
MKHFLLFPLALCALTLSSQPIITSENFFQPNQTILAFDANGVGVTDGEDGPNRIWDFTNLQATGNSVIWGGETASPNQQEGFEFFDDATVALMLPSGKLRYWKNTESSVIYIGHDGSDDLLTLNDGSTLMNYPFSYGSSQSDESNGDLSSACRNYIWESSAQTEGVGYGTLLLPSGTFENVLKVRRISFGVRKNIELDHERENNIVEYYWFSEDVSGPLLYIRQWTNNGCPGSNEGTEVSFISPNLTTEIANIDQAELSFNIFPNPANDFAILRIDTEKQTLVHITITDLLGHEIVNPTNTIQVNGSQVVDLDIAGLQKGLYLVHAASENTRYTQKLIVN